MIKVENIEIFNFEGAIRGMRNPMNSWDKSDSRYCNARGTCHDCIYRGGSVTLCIESYDKNAFIIGLKDLDLMKKLYKAGTEHRKYLRQIFVSMDITAPLYWWKEFDTYKVGTTANSCSTMHKIMSKEFEASDFSFERVQKPYYDALLDHLLGSLNGLRYKWLNEKDAEVKKDIWYSVIQLLPESYNQKRTVTMTYENVVSMIHQREGHKLDEWREFVSTLKSLPYVEEIING